MVELGCTEGATQSKMDCTEGDHHEEEKLPEGVTAEALAVAINVLEAVGRNPEALDRKDLRPLRKALTPLIWRALGRSGHGDGAATKEATRRAQKRDANREKQQKAAADKRAVDQCRLRQGRRLRLDVVKQSNTNAEISEFMVPDGYVSDEKPLLEKNETTGTYAACYSCRKRFRETHSFYGDAFCPGCATVNYTKRLQTCDLKNRVAVVTGGRVKIGHCVALKLLRGGARVFVTTRFPGDAMERFKKAEDFHDFRDRLEICGLDFRDVRSVEAFASYIDDRGPLDILINNACQTVRRPRAAYDDLHKAEQCKLQCDSEVVAFSGGKAMLTGGNGGAGSQMIVLDEDLADRGALEQWFPEGCVDVAGQQLDARDFNSWKMTLEDVPLGEAAECFAINAIAPLSLCARLKKTLKRSSHSQRFIINVSAMEAKFHRLKTFYHPHTNAAKAALNMLTRTAAADYARDFIFMNAVDTGWVNDERPLREASRIHHQHNFQTPIDEVDAASRILDPIFSVLNGDSDPVFGLFLKDYEPTDW